MHFPIGMSWLKDGQSHGLVVMQRALAASWANRLACARAGVAAALGAASWREATPQVPSGAKLRHEKSPANGVMPGAVW